MIIEGSSCDNMAHKTVVVTSRRDVPVESRGKLVLVTSEVTRVVFCSGKVRMCCGDLGRAINYIDLLL